jgi:hypothetical protein
LTASTQGPCRAAASVGLLAACLLTGISGPAAATQTDTRPDPATDAGVMIAQRHEQASDAYVRNAPELRGRAAEPRPAFRAGHRATTFTLFTRPDEFNEVDTGKTGDSVGDLVAFTDVVVDRADRPIGHAAAACMRTSPRRGESQCTATLVLDEDGSIALQGIITDADGPPLKIAVVGGTGAFSGASGTMTVTADPSNPAGLRLAFRLLG